MKIIITAIAAYQSKVALGFKTLVEINTDCKQNLITLLNK
jgi:hypothetical protein